MTVNSMVNGQVELDILPRINSPFPVVGRTAYDNFVVQHARLFVPLISVVDVTKTNPVLHQTGAGGNFQGHINARGRDYNRLLVMGYQFSRFSRISATAMIARWRPNGSVRFHRKGVKAPVSDNETDWWTVM
jgi:hypothetical protein